MSRTILERYGIVPVDAPHGASFPCWGVHDHKTGQLVKALSPAPEPLLFFSFDRADAWVQRNKSAQATA
ncbi:hypothetical protein ACIBJD_31365 [Kitasatospora sp. NPDC050467]|uniref:hypothetical protein n=1 Tax=Kitasatospora sp. NPDC050467 TaxID=3364053 RepID=UPI0037B931ED